MLGGVEEVRGIIFVLRHILILIGIALVRMELDLEVVAMHLVMPKLEALFLIVTTVTHL